MEKKIIGSGHGWRIVADQFASISWSHASYKSGTIIVHLPSRSADYFYFTGVVTEGISGQPQLTFDDPAKAQSFADYLNQRGFSGTAWRISKIRGDYECYKFPLRISGGTIDAWLSTRQFPPEGSEKWQHLCELFPRYFSNIRRGFFHENYQDRVVEYPIPEYQEILNIINSGSSEEQKCKDLFDVNLTDLQRLNKKNYDELISPIEEHYIVSYNDYDAPYQWSLFIHADYEHEPEMNLTQSCKHYCFGEYTPDGHYAGNHRDIQGWWVALEATIEYWAENGDNIRHSVKRRGFFDENLLENINRNFTTNRQISEIMDNPELSLEEKCKRLFDRTPQHVFDFGMSSFRVTTTVSELAEQNNKNIWELEEVDTFKISEVKRQQCPTVHVMTLMCQGGSSQPFDVQESWDFYVRGKRSKYGSTRDNPIEPLHWWKYLKVCVEVYEEAAGYGEKKRGFFSESLIGRNLTGEEIVAIMHDQNLNLTDKCFKLFGKGRTPEYVRALQHSTYSNSSLDKYRGETDLRQLKLVAGDLAYEAERIGKNRTGKLSMFISSGGCDLAESYNYYCVERGHFSNHNPETEEERALFWWEYIDYCVQCLEETGLVPDAPHNKTRGFFGS